MNVQEPNHLYTVIVGFNDFTQGIEQYVAPSPEEAVARFVRDAACLQEFPPDARAQLIAGGTNIKLVHVANDFRGVWLWVRAQSNDSRVESVLGGQVIQTDYNSPIRKAA